MITHTVKLDVVPGGVPPDIWLSQEDSDFSIAFELLARTGTLAIESGTTAEVRGTMPDGTAYTASATLDGTTVTLTGGDDLTSVAGSGVYEVTLTCGTKRISTTNFAIHVERATLE